MLAKRSKLAEVGRPFDRAALKPQFLRRGIIMNRGVRVVDLGIEHLMRPAPWPDERIGSLRDDRFKRLRSHRTPRKRQIIPGAGDYHVTGRYPISSGHITPKSDQDRSECAGIGPAI